MFFVEGEGRLIFHCFIMSSGKHRISFPLFNCEVESTASLKGSFWSFIFATSLMLTVQTAAGLSLLSEFISVGETESYKREIVIPPAHPSSFLQSKGHYWWWGGMGWGEVGWGRVGLGGVG